MRDSDRPWLRKDTIYAVAPNGVLVSNASAGFEITGNNAYALFDKVAPLFDGNISVGSIKASVPENIWLLMLQIIEPLAKHGFLRWIPQEDFDILERDIRDKFSDQIAFLAQYTDNPHAAFRDFHKAEIVLVGDEDPILDSLRKNLVENGASRVTMVSTIGKNIPGELLVFGPTGLRYLGKEVSGNTAQMVICPAGNKIWTLPVHWGEEDARWIAGHNSMQQGSLASQWNDAFLAARKGSPAWNHATSSEAVQRLYGALLAYEIFKGITGAIPAETGSSLFAIDCLTGETEIHRITPIFDSIDYAVHATLTEDHDSHEGWCDESVTDIPAPKFSSADSRSNEYDARWALLVDPVTMPAIAFEDLDLTQIPLKISAVRTRWGMVRTTSAWTTADARIDAIAIAYSVALTIHAQDEGQPASVVFGVDRTAAQAVSRALELIVNSIEVGSGTVVEKHSIRGRLKDFVDEVSDGAIDFEHVGEVAGFQLERANFTEWSHIATGASREQAQVRAAINVLGSAQAAAASDIHLCLADGFNDIFSASPRIRTMELTDGWHIALVRPGEDY